MNDQAATTAQTDARTPSLAASLFVVGVMVGLILFSVIQFGSEVADGPLQVSMTLATLVALGVAYAYGHRGAVISEAVQKSISGTLGTMMVLLAIPRRPGRGARRSLVVHRPGHANQRLHGCRHPAARARADPLPGHARDLAGQDRGRLREALRGRRHLGRHCRWGCRGSRSRSEWRQARPTDRRVAPLSQAPSGVSVVATASAVKEAAKAAGDPTPG